MLELKGLRKRFDDHTAVDGVSLTVAPGEFFALLGPSGCGKTTLLRMIAGLEMPDEGTIGLAGRDITRVPAEGRPIHTVFQRYALFPHMNVGRNVGFGLEVRGVPVHERGLRIREALKLVRLEGFEDRAIQTLSGGQQQRVALARAIINEPKVLLLDEPLSALDLKLREEMRAELQRLHARLGTTFILVTHDQDEALSLASRVAVMCAGRVEQVGSPEAVYSRPVSSFVAGFVGTANRLTVEILGEEAGLYRVRNEGTVWKVSPGSNSTPSGLGRVRELMLRPEAVRVRRPGEEDPTVTNSLYGRVEATRFLGASYELRVRDEQEREWVVWSPNRNQPLQRGERVWLGFSAEAGVLLS